MWRLVIISSHFYLLIINELREGLMLTAVYVSGSSQELPRVRAVQERLRALGFEIADPWTDAVAQFGSAGKTLTRSARRERAQDDLEGIRGAEVFLLLWPVTPSIGAYVELGAALAVSRIMVVTAGGADSTIWHTVADHTADDDTAAIAWITAQYAQ